MKITHVVFKKEDIEVFLTPEQKLHLKDIATQIWCGRLDTKRKGAPEYIVVNRNESYVDEVIAVLKRHGHWDEEEAE